MKNINIDNKPCTMIEKIKLYKDTFWEYPWNKWFVCKNCWKYYNKKYMWKCSCWNSKLKPFYENKELKETFKDLLEKGWYKEALAKTLDNNLVWFIWWWESSLEKLNIDKLWLDNKQYNILIEWIRKIFPNFNLDKFYYLDEIWVKKEYRWNDIAWKLYRKNIEYVKETWQKYVVVRTTRKSDVPYKWFIDNWYKVVYCYNDEQDRVILVKNNK